MLRNLFLGLFLGASFCCLFVISYLVYWTLGFCFSTEIYSAIGMVCWFIFFFLPYIIFKYYPLDEATRKLHTPAFYLGWFVLAAKGVFFVVFLWPGFWLAAFFGLKVLNYVELIDDHQLLSNKHPKEMKAITAGKFKLMTLCIFLGVLFWFTPFYEFFIQHFGYPER